ncbi:MAG: selenobiotic family radical SAM modification target peptide [Candidatus Omnitrophica bacterium]|nr:selenobiotic family radical SAM modification target peptide [Candidatus Omnitrophota bacterium]
MKNRKIKKIMAGIGVASLVAGMSVNAQAGSHGNSCGKGGEKKGFFQSMYDSCKGESCESEEKSSRGKGSKKSSKSGSSCGKGSCGK